MRGIEFPRIGIGTWPWGDRRIWRFDPLEGPRDAEAAFHAAIEGGVAFFDTAEIYGGGESERLLGRFVRASGRAVQVATKFAPHPGRFTAASLTRALDESLRRLGLDRVDLYQIHWPYTWIHQDALMERLADAVRAGKAGAAGVSNYGAPAMRRAHAALAARGVPLAANQVSYSLLDRAPESNGVLAACRELGVTLIAYSPLAMGVLSGKYHGGPREGLRLGLPRRLTRSFLRLRRAEPVLDALARIGADHGATPAQVALAWLLGRPGVVPIPSARNAAQARENAGALALELGAAEIALLDAVSAP